MPRNRKCREGRDVSYSRLILWVTKDYFVPVVIDYYDEKDPTLWEKRLLQTDIRLIDNIPTAMKVVMENKLDHTQTELELIDVKYNIPLDDKMFTERNLKKSAPGDQGTALGYVPFWRGRDRICVALFFLS